MQWLGPDLEGISEIWLARHFGVIIRRRVALGAVWAPIGASMERAFVWRLCWWRRWRRRRRRPSESFGVSGERAPRQFHCAICRIGRRSIEWKCAQQSSARGQRDKLSPDFQS